MVMVFFSGADAIPPMGYPHEPLINFNPACVSISNYLHLRSTVNTTNLLH